MTKDIPFLGKEKTSSVYITYQLRKLSFRMPPFIAFSTCPASVHWAQELNGDLTPDDVGRGYKKTAWFECPNKECGHFFEKQVCAVSCRKDGTVGCPYCCNFSKLICEDPACPTCYWKSFASCDLAANWSPRNKKTARQVIKGTTVKYWMNCFDCGHEFLCNIRNASQGKFCGYCYGIKLCPDEDCDWCWNASFASTDEAQYWADRNLPAKPRDFFKGRQEKFWFDCDCGHQVFLSLEAINKGYWCHYCCVNATRRCPDKECQICFEKTVAASDLAEYWSSENKLEAWQVFKVSDGKYWMDCDCGHTFLAKLTAIKFRGVWCPYCCSAPKKLCEKEDCQQCFERSFASHYRASGWSIKNSLTARQVCRGSAKKYLFDCDKDPEHEFLMSPGQITGPDKSWCSKCRYKIEDKVFRLLSKEFKIERQSTFQWCRHKRCLPFDFWIEETDILIELDGDQHFWQVSNWTSPEEVQERDHFKMDKALENGYSVIRIPWFDVFHDQNEWYETLIETIWAVSQAKPCVVYLGTNGEYDDYKIY